jgi:hypothetical protein
VSFDASGLTGVAERLDDASDRISPIVVKEVRQIVRGREFNYSFALTLVAALIVAAFGAGDALNEASAGGSRIFGILTVCLALLGFVVVPLGAFNALRFERLEQTLDLITLTALSPRRIVLGKLAAQAVKLVTFFSLMAPFVATSFLLGGIDFVSVLLTLAIVFMWSLWVCAAALMLSTLFRFKAMGGALVAVVVFVVLVLFGGVGRFLLITLFGPLGAVSFGVAFSGTTGPDAWRALAVMSVLCVVTGANLVLLAENRLSSPTGNRVTPLRVGFAVQLLVLVGLALLELRSSTPVRGWGIDVLTWIAGAHLAVVATFVVTESADVPRRTLVQMLRWPMWRRMALAPFYPGPGRGAIYVLLQMAAVIGAAWVLDASFEGMRRLMALCGFICLFTGVPALVRLRLAPIGARAIHARVAVLLLIPQVMLLPDVIYHLLWRPEVLDLAFGARHLVNPFRTLINWAEVESRGWMAMPIALALTGVLSYVTLIIWAGRATSDQEISYQTSVAPTVGSGEADGVAAAG